MNIGPLIIQIVALVCFFLDAFHLWQGPPNKPSWTSLGLFLWLVSLMISGITLHPTSGVH